MKQVKLNITLPKGYIVIKSQENVITENVKEVFKILKLAEEKNILFSESCIDSLLKTENIKIISDELNLFYKTISGEYFRGVFGTSEDLKDEEFTYSDYINQINHYIKTYFYGLTDQENKTDINLKTKTEYSLKIIKVKNINEFKTEIIDIINLPLVFGESQVDFLTEANRIEILKEILKENNNISIKENLFKIIEIIGKEFIKENNILKTANDILRYCYFASELDYINLNKGELFKLKTSDKGIIMKNLDRLFSDNSDNVLTDIKTKKSQWLSVSKNLFPGSKKFKRYESAQILFTIIRNEKIVTFNTVTQNLINKKDYFELINHLSKKPGELLRNIDMILRKSDKKARKQLRKQLKIIFLNPKLILEIKSWLIYRSQTGVVERVFNVKGIPFLCIDKPVSKLKHTKKIIKILDKILIKHIKNKELF